eukprot:Blabericola_migrator_1__8002@NODE_4101_length_1333_cov_521_600316_g2534_i0_p1_GENE_NODE_4101_length_1333_cov_521_600316_g2534_i0NODE_4101_length_1333_cov_521_600316_g2534_i0_p1_ORF_typecomplete_len210_score51_76CS/PF04969_16/2_3e13MFS18/PF17352_2/0_013ArsA_HSP20/PF17886_1/0_039HSP20/PF00011_21/0_056fn3_6/PF17766_1/0_13Glyco_hydro2_C5/PF18565_1/0_22Forkhead_N/PF08430_12/0_4_NODE_4101_length_1333_cov_521_600316_g2534_i0296925
MPIQPPTLWSQRKDSLYVTIEVIDPEDVKVTIEEQSLSVSCKKEGREYAVTLPLYAKIAPEESKYAVKRSIICHLTKVDKQRWPCLLANKEKRQTLKVDWNTWLDTDDEEEAAKSGAGGFNMDDFDMGGMGGLGGMGGMGGMPGMGDLGGLGGMGGMGGMDDMESDEEDPEIAEQDEENEIATATSPTSNMKPLQEVIAQGGSEGSLQS